MTAVQRTLWTAALSCVAVYGQDRIGEQISHQVRTGIEHTINDVIAQVTIPPIPGSMEVTREDDYQRGQQALDRRQYEQAIKRFEQVISEKGSRADGATYWKAYALNKLGRRDQALATLSEFEKQYPQSRWLNDARALGVEVRASNGQPASPESQADEDLKLFAVNSLIRQDPDRAIPLLEKVLNESKNPPSLKSRALYVLAQSKTPRAQEIVIQYAKGGSNPDLQVRAVEYLGTIKSPESLQTLMEVYSATNDATVKREVAGALYRQGAARQLVDLARKETNLDTKRELVRQLSRMRSSEATEFFVELLSK